MLAAALTLVREGDIYLPSLLPGAPSPTAVAQAEASSRSGKPSAGATDETLTPRELDVLRLLCGGSSNKEIANCLGIAEPTVRTHLSAVFRALGVSNRTQAAREARRQGLVHDN